MATISKFESPAKEYESLSELNLHSLVVGEKEHAVFFARAEGTNLKSMGIFDGDLLICNRAVTPTHGSVVLSVVDGEFIARVLDVEGQRLLCDHESPISIAGGVQIEAVVTQSLRMLQPL